MDFEKLVHFIKKALASSNDVSTADVQRILKEQVSGDEEQENDTVDSNITDISDATQEEAKNEEGKLLEQSFPELEVEKAIEQAREEAKFRHIEEGEKTASIWDILQQNYCNSATNH